MIQSLIRTTLFARLLIPRPKSYLFCRRLNSGGYLISRLDRTFSFSLPFLFILPIPLRLASPRPLLSLHLCPSSYFQSGSSLKESSIASFLFPASDSFALLPYIHLRHSPSTLTFSTFPPFLLYTSVFLHCPLQADILASNKLPIQIFFLSRRLANGRRGELFTLVHLQSSLQFFAVLN